MSTVPHTIQTIIDQLGGKRIFAMAFSGSAYAGENQLTLRIAPALVRGARERATHVRINLNAMDTYDVEVMRCTRAIGKTVSYDEGIYADQLRKIVELRTGLALTL